MMDEPRPDLDRRLRDAFAPDPGAVARVSAGADARARRGSTSPRAASLARVAALCVAGGAVVAVLMLLLVDSRMLPPAAEPGRATVFLSGSFTDGLLVVSLPDGTVAITGGEAQLDRPQDGYGIVLAEGELR